MTESERCYLELHLDFFETVNVEESSLPIDGRVWTDVRGEQVSLASPSPVNLRKVGQRRKYSDLCTM